MKSDERRIGIVMPRSKMSTPVMRAIVQYMTQKL